MSLSLLGILKKYFLMLWFDTAHHDVKKQYSLLSNNTFHVNLSEVEGYMKENTVLFQRTLLLESTFYAK